MNNLYSSEISLRAAIISAKKNTTNTQDFTANIKSHAMNQIELVQKAEGLVNGVKSAESIEKAAIAAAVGGIQLAYKAISLSFEEAKSKRRQFIEECEKYLATFVIDNNKEQSEFSYEQLAIKEFYAFLQKRGIAFIQYSGIEVKEKEDCPNVMFLSILPFFKMSQSLPHHQIIASKLDEYRQSIYHFLHSGLPLEYYYKKFLGANSFLLKMSSLFKPENDLNYYRAPRFIITALANLVWNLQHPVHIETGMPLSNAEAIALCYNAEMFLNDLLNPRQFPYLDIIDSKSKRLSQCLYRMELNIKGLKNSFEYEHLHEINLKSVSLHMHSALKVMSNKMLELIYQNEKAGENLISLIMAISTLFLHHPTLYNHFSSMVTQPLPPHLNPIPCTIIDIIMLFCMLEPKKRYRFCQDLINSYLEPETQLAYQLREFHNTFLSPFESKAIEPIQKLHPEKNKYQLSASYFLPLIVLMMESFTVFKDTRPHKSQHLNNELYLPTETIEAPYNLANSTNDKKQAQLILDGLMIENPDYFYHWSISMFFKFNTKHHHSINQLLAWQNEIRHHTAKLDEYADLISKNRLCLQGATLRHNLIEFLTTVCDLFSTLNQNFGSIATQMQTNAKIHRDEKRVLHPMLDDLETIVTSIQKSIQQVKTIISAPDFEAAERQKIYENNSLIQQYQLPMARAHSPLKMTQRNSMRRVHYEHAPLPPTQVHLAVEGNPNAYTRVLEPQSSPRTENDIPTVTSLSTQKETDTSMTYNQLLLYASEACMGITSIIFAVNAITPFMAISLAISIITCFTSLATTIALGMFHYYKFDPKQEDIFYFKTPAL